MTNNRLNASITSYFLAKFCIDACVIHIWTRDGLITMSQKMEVAG